MNNITITILCLFLAGQIQGQSGDLNMKIIAHVPSPSGGSGIWHYVDKNGIEYAALGTGNALVIYSLEDPANPIERARVPGVTTIWREVFSYKDYIYAVTDSRSDGIIIVNMKNAPNNITSKFWTTTITAGNLTNTITTCHTVYIDEKGILCLNGCQPWQGTLFFDLNQDPENPVFLGAETVRYVHDSQLRNDTLYTSDIYEGLLSIWDVKNKMNPVELATIRTPFAFTHNSWISDDAKYVFTTDEKNNASVAAYDISDLSNIRLVDEWRPKDTEGTGVIPHNTRYLNGYLITAYYTDGVKIVDAHKPDNLIEVGSVDTYFGNQTGFHGCWGVSPYLPSGTIIASDIEGGLFVIQPEYIRACYLEGKVSDSLTSAPIANVTITITAPRINNEQTNLKGEYKTGYATAGIYEVNFNHPDYIPASYMVELQNGVLTIQNVKLLRIKTITQRIVVKDKKTLQTLEGAHVLIQNTKRTTEGITAPDGATELIVTQDNEDYELIVGKWGYLHKSVLYNSLNPSAEVVILLDKGYQDDFIFDLNWMESGSASTGHWTRAEPIGTTSNNNRIQTDSDVAGDYGHQCYVTGNGSSDPAADDVDNGNTILLSPIMDLSTYNEPLLNYYYWFVNAGGNNTPNDKLSFKIISETDTFLIRQVNQSNPLWIEEKDFRIRYLTQKLDNLRFLVETADDNPGHLVEAAIDAFLVTEGNPVKNKNTQTDSPVEIYPSLFKDETRLLLPKEFNTVVELSIYDLHGNIVENLHVDSQRLLQFGRNYKPGIYMVLITNAQGVIGRQKIVKL